MVKHLTFQPLTPSRWNDLEALFGERGACGGCWCMLWRITRKKFESHKGDGNRRSMKRIVAAGKVPGILAYHEGRAIGWCSIAPRSEFPALARSRILQPVDAQPCWSVSCLFVERSYRNKGISTKLLRAAARYAKSRGARLIEGYPVEPTSAREIPPVFAWTGISSSFARAGFKEVARRSPTRPIMRKRLR